jgi:sugar lactone lactonase YvrE
MKKIKFYFMSMCLLLGGGTVYAGMANGVPNIVLGQPDFVTAAAGSGTVNLTDPHFVVVNGQSGRVYVADTGNSRVLWWDSVDALSNGKAADGVIGAGTLGGPTSMAFDGSGNFWVADAGNHRVLRFPAGNFTAPDLVLGQTDMSSINNGIAANRMNVPRSISFDTGGNLWVVDTGNHRALRFSPPFASGMDANLVLGQSNFTDNTQRSSSGSPDAGSFWAPQTVFADPSGNIWVADHLNHRVLRFSPPFANGMNANLVLGQKDFVNGGQNPTGYPTADSIFCAYGITMDANGNVWVADYSNNRVLRYSGTLKNGMAASQVIGQADFSVGLTNRGSGAAGADTLYHPCAVIVDPQGNLWIAEGGNEGSHAGSNNRVLKFNTLRIVSLDIASCNNVGPKRIAITGQGIVAGTKARLVRTGQRDITATNVTIPDNESGLAGTFDLAGVQPGAWDLVLEGGNMSARLANALTVTTIGIASITPNSALNTGPVNVVITGEHIEPGATIKLKRQKYGEISASNVTMSSTQVQCTFDITDARTGKWSVVISSGAAVGTLADAFAVHFPSYTVRYIQRTRSYYIGIETAQGEVAFEIPTYTFPQDLTMAISDPEVLPPVAQQEFRACDVAADVVCSPDLQPDNRMTVTATCADLMLEGHNRNRMVMTYYDAPLSRWVQMASRAIPEENAVASLANHVSLYRLLERVPSSDLSNTLVYPNPFKPGSDTGYDESSLGSGVAFAGLTGSVTLKIFNVAGELVRQIDQQDGTGVILWDTKTDQGDKAASGVYLYLINNPDTGENRKGKFSIIR